MTSGMSYIGAGSKTSLAVATKLVAVAHIAAERGLEPDDREVAATLRETAAEELAAVFGGKLPSETWLSEAIRRHPLSWRNAFVDWRIGTAA